MRSCRFAVFTAHAATRPTIGRVGVAAVAAMSIMVFCFPFYSLLRADANPLNDLFSGGCAKCWIKACNGCKRFFWAGSVEVLADETGDAFTALARREGDGDSLLPGDVASCGGEEALVEPPNARPHRL